MGKLIIVLILLTYLFVLRVVGQVPFTTCMFIPYSKGTSLICSCNDRLFPSTSLPRAPGDTSFRPAPIGRGCCGALPNGDHHQDEDESSMSLHDAAFKPQVLLIDAGCEWMGYASDITRTIPVGNGGKYTEKAGHIYELVLRMQKVSQAVHDIRVRTLTFRKPRIWSSQESTGISYTYTRIKS